MGLSTEIRGWLDLLTRDQTSVQLLTLGPGLHQTVVRLRGGAGDHLCLDAGHRRRGENAQPLQEGVCLSGASVVVKTVELVVGVVGVVCDV